MNHLCKSKLESAGLLILGMERLRVSLVPVSRAALDDAGSVDDAVDRGRIAAALTNAVLYTVVVELVVKHFWEQEHGKTAEHTHDVRQLFCALSSDTQRDIRALYDTCCIEYKDAVNAGRKQHGPGAVAVEMADLDEAFRWNQNAVRNLKYEMTPSGRSVPAGLFWDSNTVWVLPPTSRNFAIELTRWAARRGIKKPPPASGSLSSSPT